MGFRVQSRLGRGRVVDTFDAILDVKGEKLDVLIKRTRPEFSGHAALQDTLLEWGRAQAMVDHPDVVAVLEAGRDSSGVYIIQERVEGATLARVLGTLRRSRRTLSPANALVIAERVAAGVAGLAKYPALYHGNVRPTVVLLGYDGTVKIADQRLADLAAVEGLDLEPDPAESEYQAPEGPSTGPVGDGYSVALVMLETMLGHPVWLTSSMSVDDALRALVDFAPVAQAQPRLAVELRDLLQPYLQPEAAARPASMSTLVDGFVALINDHALLRNAEALGSFVELVCPPLDDSDAPTRIAVASELAPVSRGESSSPPVPTHRKADFEAASVVITPEILARAEADYRRAREGKAETPRTSSNPRRPRPPTLEGRSVPVEPLQALPQAPSSLKAQAAELPNVAAKAAVAMAEAGISKWWLYAAAGALVLFIGWSLSGSSTRSVRLRVTSEPSSAAVFVDDQLLGRTPLTTRINVEDNQIDLRFEREGFEAHRVTIETEEDELRYQALLKALPR